VRHRVPPGSERALQWSLFVDKLGYRNKFRPGFRLRIDYWIGDRRKILMVHILSNSSILSHSLRVLKFFITKLKPSLCVY